MKYYILFAALSIYLIWTLIFTIKFNRTDIYFNRKQKIVHNILIWLIPFIWIMLIKTMTKPLPGSQGANRKNDKGSFYESGIRIWSDGHESNSGH